MIVDAFYLLFKSDSKDAVKDIAELEKKVDSLKQKGKGRSEQENKDYKEYQKQLKERNKDLKEEQQAYDRLTDSLARYAASYFSLNAIKSSFLNTVQSNAALQNQADLLGQNSAELKAYGAAAKAAGGSAEALYGYQQSLFERFADLGLNTPEIGNVFTKIREQLKLAGNNPTQREKVFQNFGVPQELKTLLSLGDEDYNRAIAQAHALTSNIAEAGKVSKEFAAIWAGYDQTIDDINTKLSSKLLPLFKSFYDFAVATGRLRASDNFFFPSQSSYDGSSSEAKEKARIFKLSHGDSAHPRTNVTDAFKKNVSGDESQNQSDPLAAQKKAFGIPTYDPIIEEQLHLGQINRAKQNLDSISQTPIGVSNVTVGSSGARSISVKTGDIHVHSAATDASGIASDVSSQLERHINMAISNMDDGVAR